MKIIYYFQKEVLENDQIIGKIEFYGIEKSDCFICFYMAGRAMAMQGIAGIAMGWCQEETVPQIIMNYI